MAWVSGGSYAHPRMAASWTRSEHPGFAVGTALFRESARGDSVHKISYCFGRLRQQGRLRPIDGTALASTGNRRARPVHNAGPRPNRADSVSAPV